MLMQKRIHRWVFPTRFKIWTPKVCSQDKTGKLILCWRVERNCTIDLRMYRKTTAEPWTHIKYLLTHLTRKIETHGIFSRINPHRFAGPKVHRRTNRASLSNKNGASLDRDNASTTSLFPKLR